MSNDLLIRFAEPDDINIIGFLAQQIWPHTYGEIVEPAQLDYMMNLMYSPAALKRQIKDDHQRFLIVEDEEEAVGFASFSPVAEPGIYKLHKIYVLPGQQGRGVGKAILDFILDEIKPEGARVLQLNVNRYNKARDFYERMGFAVIREEDIDIGGGYFMNDYVMEKKI